MKILFIVAFFVTLLIGAASFIGDWGNFLISNTDYEFVPNSYSDQVGLANKKTGTIAIPQHIVDYRLIDNILFVLRAVSETVTCIDIDEREATNRTLMTHYTKKKEYYYIDLISNKTYGPFTKKDFHNTLNQLEVKDVELRLPSEYRSNSRSFYKKTSKCDSLNK